MDNGSALEPDKDYKPTRLQELKLNIIFFQNWLDGFNSFQILSSKLYPFLDPFW